MLKPAVGGQTTDGVAQSDEPQQTVNPYSIMQEIAKAVYLEDVLFAKFGSQQRTEVRCLNS